MIEFKKIHLQDRGWMQERLQSAQYWGCEYSFANLYMWSGPSSFKVADVDGFLCIMGQSYGASEPVYLYPAGIGSIESVIGKLMEDAKERGVRFFLRAVRKEQAEQLEELFPGLFEVENIRDEWDYLYSVEKLSTLAGKKYHGKRNHIARFKDVEDWLYEPITKENIEECIQMNDIWCEEYGCKKEVDLVEQCAVREAMKHFEELHLEGGLLRKANRVVAFTMGEPLNKEVYVVHIEKAFHDVQGAYPMINQQFVLHNMKDYPYVNREEDFGEEGLRKAKLSYRPDILLEKHMLRIKDTNGASE